MDQFERRDLFNKAADFLQKEQWAQGHMMLWEGDQPSYCLVGALRMVTVGTAYLPDPDGSGEEDWFGDETQPNERYAGFPAEELLCWNDGVAKSVDDVVKRLREMAAGKHDDIEVWRQEIQAARS